MVEGKGRSRRRLQAIANDPPSTVRTAREIGGVMLDEMTRLGGGVGSAGTQEFRVPEDEPWGITALGEQRLRTMQVCEHAVEQQGALGDTALDCPPLRSRKKQRDRIEHPRPKIQRTAAVRAFGTRGIEIEGDPVILEMLAQSLATLREAGGA
jgi:hypothetical protein